MQGIYVLDKKSNIIKRDQILSGDIVIKEGIEKPGRNGHVHILVHRKDRQGKLSLSPLSHSKGG